MFNRLFFAMGDPVVATLTAFASFAVGFVARPLGGLLFGHLGDRIGRRTCLRITVVMIGVVTGLIGVLPDVTDIGVAAPVLLTLLRLLQGVAVGGEWGRRDHPRRRARAAREAGPLRGDAPDRVPGRHAPVVRRVLLVALLPPDDFDSGGWRTPFLAAFPLPGVALWLRRRVSESPLFDRLLAEDARASAPVRDVVVRAWPALLVGAGSALLGVGGFHLATTFAISDATGDLDLPRPLVLGATLVAAVVEIGVLVLGGRLAERFGAARVTRRGSTCPRRR